MNMNFFLNLFFPKEYKKLLDYDSLILKYDTAKSNISFYKQKLSISTNNALSLYNDLQGITDKNSVLIQSGKILTVELAELVEENERLVKKSLSQIDEFLKSKFKVIPNKAYKNKRKVFGVDITVYLNQLITPDSFEVCKYRSKIKTENKDSYEKAKLYGGIVAKDFTWTSDKNMYNSADFYTYAEEMIKKKKDDCENHAYLICSLDHKVFGNAYGFYNAKKYIPKDNNNYGHSFNCFKWNNSLYILETTGNVPKIHKYDPANPSEKYHIHFIVTKDFTYKVDGSVEFGIIAGW